MNAEFSIGAAPSPVINRAPSNTVTGGVPACPCIWDEQATKKHDRTIADRPTNVRIEFPFLRAAHSPPREEGWLRHQENFGEAHLSAADGVVAHKSLFRCERPPRPRQFGTGLFLNGASTPPQEEGNIAYSYLTFDA